MDNIKPIKILHVVGAMNRAGTETMLMNLYRNMNREKVQFDFISYSQEDAEYDLEIRKLGGRVIKLSKTLSIKEIYDAIKQYGPYEAVHSHTLFHCGIANMAARLAGVKIRVAHAHTTLDKSDRFTRKLYIRLMRYTINTFSTNLLACSNEAGRYLFGEKRLTNIKYSYFPNVIDYSLFLKDRSKDVRKFKVEEGLGNSLVIGHIGRFIEAKNHPFLLQILKSAIKSDPTIKLMLVGDGDVREQIEEAAKKEGIYANIRFVGIRTDIPIMLRSMDIFVFPSLYEGLGLVLLEAQASGVPCVVSEAIQPEADLEIGLVSKLSLADSPEVWADKILELANKKEKNTNKIIDSFERSGYSLPLGISKLMKIYKLHDGGVYEKYIDRLL
ncbi:glycosyltransferase family 1 protein [Peribacillus cavernae]|uniref:Glycosyltransferase family 1 protein n=1 Tax=Peribacillus cavernae TaxID=1674310 RepID=A0A3S0VL96_9BACI|nr:glycosyltransferase family 1 protein [Peribacillus cavernae]MDQ0217486.1 glycosyltransferase EpsF [Peribacillus cavernae]RUQ30072.1 glycosyltransferase family 1 protein [Peribacillus cavernae]